MSMRQGHKVRYIRWGVFCSFSSYLYVQVIYKYLNHLMELIQLKLPKMTNLSQNKLDKLVSRFKNIWDFLMYILQA